MLQLTYSNRTEALLDRLAERIETAWSRDGRAGIWDPALIVVPNPHLKEYMRIELARRLGVAANLRFCYLNGLWRELFSPEQVRILDSGLLRSGLLSVLDDPGFLGLQELGPVRHYLSGDPHGLKVVQLATELARLFEEYQYSRPEWIRRWRTGRNGASAAENWQRLAWLRTVAALDASGFRHLTLDEALRDASGLTGRLPATIHAFGLSHVAQVYHEVYTRLGQLPATALHLYALNPCAEFWEDLVTERERRAPRPRRGEARRPAEEPESADEDVYGLSAQGPEALRRWGRPGRENIRLLNEISGCDFQADFVLPAGDSLLERIQADILCFQEPSGTTLPDASVRFLAAPSPRREAELVATEIWRLMEAHAAAGRPLSFSEIAVIVPPAQQEAYLAHLQAAFDETQRIPWIHSEGAPLVLRQTLEAVELLLDLPTSGLTRAALLRVLSAPALGRRFGDLDPETWTHWCADLGIVRGADRADWVDTYLDQDALNWDQGLKRLALGAFMGDGCQAGAYRPHATAELASAGTFLTLARRLLDDGRQLAAARLELRAWVPSLEAYLATWLEADDELSVRAFERIRAYLARLAETVPAGLKMSPMTFAAARALVLEALGSLRNEQPVSLARGVVVSSYTPMRAIPFQAVFLMGLGEGVFPTRDQRSALDLRTSRRQTGDVSQTEKERYLFLETLLSTREHLILSYVALDEVSGEPLEPSGLFKEFRSLAGRYLEAGGEPPTEIHPLRRFDPSYFPEWYGKPPDPLRTYSAVAQAEARARWLRHQLASQGPLTLPASLGALPVPAATRTLLEDWLHAPGSTHPAAREPVLRIALTDLKKWLECPLTGAAAVRLGLRQEDLEDHASVEDEPFESAFFTAWALQRDVAWQVLQTGSEPEAAYAELQAALQARGAAPFGVFAERERRDHLQGIQGWVAHLKSRTGQPVLWRFGPGRPDARPADRAEPAIGLNVELHGNPLRLELTGDLQPQWEGSLFLESGAPPSPSGLGNLRRKALGAYLEHVVLAWVDPSHGEHRARFVFQAARREGRGKDAPLVQERAFRFTPIPREEARRILADWLRDLLTGDHAVLLPIEAVLEGWLAGELTQDSIREFVEEALEQGSRGLFSTLRGPVPEPARYEPPAAPLAIVSRRYGAFLEQIRGVEA